MKKISYFLSVLLTCSLLSSGAKAFAWPDYTPLLPWSSQFCPTCIAPTIMMAESYIRQGIQVKRELEQITNISYLKQFLRSYTLGLGETLFSALKNRLSFNQKREYSMTIEKCKKANIDVSNAESVQKGFISLFLEYPSPKVRIQNAYRKKGNDLKTDVMLEAYVTSMEMARRLYGQTENTPDAEEKEERKAKGNTDISKLGLLTQFKYVEQCLLEGNQTDETGMQKISDACRKTGLDDCSGTSTDPDEQKKEDSVCLWKNAVLAMRLYEQFMVYNEYITSMLQEYEAVQAINSTASIRTPDEGSYGVTKIKKQNESSVMSEKIKSGLIKTKAVEFRDFSLYADEEVTLSAEDEAVFDAYEKNLQSDEKITVGKFERTDKVEGFKSPLEEKEEDFESLSALAEIEENLDTAVNMHNMKQNLPNYRKVYRNYDETQKYYDQVMQNLENSGKCVVNFLSPYYSNATKIWFGDKCNYYGKGMIYCHYQTEKSVNQANSEETKTSLGEFDILCPDDRNHMCYIKSMRDSKYNRGLIGYLMNLYQTIKDNQASQEVEAYIETTDVGNPDSNVTEVDIKLAYKSGGDAVSANADSQNAEIKSASTFEEAYQQATEEENSDESSVVTPNGNSTLQSLSSLQAQAAPEDASEMTNIKNYDAAEQEKKEARKGELLNWSIGAEVVKDIAQDLTSPTPQFGAVKKRFPLWYDQKEYYNQYIDGKYTNIKNYLNSDSFLSKFVQATKDLIAEYPYKSDKGINAERKRKEDIKSITDFYSANMEKVAEKSVVEKEFAEADALKKAKRAELEQSVKSINAAIYDQHKKIDVLNKQISILNRIQNNQEDNIMNSDGMRIYSEEGLEYSKKMYAGRDTDPAQSEQNKTFQKNKEDSEDNKDNAERILSEIKLSNNIPTLEKQVEQAKEKIKRLEEDEEKIRSDYVLAISNLEETNRLKMEELQQQDATNKELLSAIEGAAAEIAPAGIIKQVMDCMRAYTVQQVEKTQKELEILKDNEELYYEAYADKVTDIHKKLMKKITSVSVTDFKNICPVISTLGDLGLAVGLDELLKNVLSMVDDVCAQDVCMKPDSDYFVGIVAKKRDFTAPKSPMSFTSAPAREIFHFDMQDISNVDRYIRDKRHQDDNENIILSKESIMSSGVEIPEVWKRILADHAYVERDFDLKKLLGDEQKIKNSEKAFVRSGIYPCMSEKQKKVVDIQKDFTYTLKEPTDIEAYRMQLPVCQTAQYGIYDKKRDRTTPGVQDTEIAIGWNNTDSNDAIGATPETSELGQILSYIPDKEEKFVTTLNGMHMKANLNKIKYRLTFNNKLLQAYKYIEDMHDFGKDTAADYRYTAGMRALYQRNQLGDYLNYMEFERDVSNSLQALEDRVGDIRQSLSSTFIEADYQMNEDFSLLEQEDYDKAAEVLNSQKEIYLNLAKNALKNIQGKTKYIAKKVAEIQHKIEVLEKDADEVVQISGDEDLDELDSHILTQNADAAIAGEYDKAAEEEFSAQLEKMSRPLCVSYPVSVKNVATPPLNDGVNTNNLAVKAKAAAIENKLN